MFFCGGVLLLISIGVVGLFLLLGSGGVVIVVVAVVVAAVNRC